MPHIAQLEAFLQTVACGNLLQASERMNVSHSTVSARIKALEGVLGTPLFRRGRHGVEPTEAGQALLPLATTAVQAWSQARHSVRAIAAGRVPIRAGIQQDFWELFAATWFADLQTQTPSAQLRLTSDYSDMLCERIEKGLMDLAVIFEPTRRHRVALETLATIPLVLVSDRPQVWNGRLPPDYFYVNWGERFDRWHLTMFGEAVNPRLIVGVSGIALSMLRQTGGTAFFLDPVVAAHIAAGRLYRVEGAPAFSVDALLALPDDPHAAASLQSHKDAIRRSARRFGAVGIGSPARPLSD